MADKLMYSPDDDTQNYPLCTLQLVDNQPIEPTNQNTISFLKVFKLTKKKTVFKNFGDYCTKTVHDVPSLPAFEVC